MDKMVFQKASKAGLDLKLADCLVCGRKRMKKSEYVIAQDKAPNGKLGGSYVLTYCAGCIKALAEALATK